MIYKVTNKRPDCLNDVDLSNCLPNKIYNIYRCKKCILDHEFDKIDRKNKKKRKMVRIAHKDPTKKHYFLFGCKHNTILLIKYKKCSCGIELFGTRLLGNRKCPGCDDSIRKPQSEYKRYYRIKMFKILSKINLNDPNKWDCQFRSYCLESTFKEGHSKGIACKGCRFYTKEVI